MSPHAPTINAEVAQHVLWQFGYLGGIEPGSFTQHLLHAFATADEINFDRLQQGFPIYAAAVAAASYDPDGIQKLQRIAGRGVAAQSDVPQCPEALYNPDTGSLLRCVQEGRHDWHKTPNGTQWNTPVDSDVEVPF